MRRVAESGTLSKAIHMGREELLMMQMFGGSGLLQVVFLAFLLAVPVFRPERIRIISTYRYACICFALSIIVPSAAYVLLIDLVSAGGSSGSGFTGIQTLQMFNAAGPILFGISLILATKSVIPGFIPPQNVSRPTTLAEKSLIRGGGSVFEDQADPKSP